MNAVIIEIIYIDPDLTIHPEIKNQEYQKKEELSFSTLHVIADNFLLQNGPSEDNGETKIKRPNSLSSRRPGLSFELS
jgi:hypothetical protein